MVGALSKLVDQVGADGALPDVLMAGLVPASLTNPRTGLSVEQNDTPQIDDRAVGFERCSSRCSGDNHTI